MAIQSVAGASIAISAGLPATFNAAGYDALTFSVIGEVTDLGEFGRVYELIRHNPINTRATRKLKGSYDEGQISMVVGLDNDDAGQILAKTASLSDADYSFQVVDQEGNQYYFLAKVMSFRRRFGTVNNIVSATIQLEISSSSTGIGVVEDLVP